jgi:hypothetical protein
MLHRLAPHPVGPHPELIVDLASLFVETAIEDVGRELFGMAHDAYNLVKVALVMAVEAGEGTGRKGIERVAA